MAVEARSLASLHALANKPPRLVQHPALQQLQQSSDPTEPAITLYIAKIPNSKNLVMTTKRPREYLTQDDITSSLYIASFDDLDEYQDRSRSWQTFTKISRTMSQSPSRTMTRRKKLPDAAKVHPALKAGSEPTSPVSEAPDILPETVDYFYEGRNQFKAVVELKIPIAMSNVQNVSQASLADRKLVGPDDATVTLIRSDPENGGAYTVARILDPSANKSVGPSSSRPAYIDVTNGGYKAFGQTVMYTQPEGGLCFTRSVYFENAIPVPKLVFLTPWGDFCEFDFRQRSMECYRVIKSHESHGINGVPTKVHVSSLRFNMNSNAAIRRESRASEDVMEEPPANRRDSRFFEIPSRSSKFNLPGSSSRDESKKPNRLSAWINRQRAASSISDSNQPSLLRRRTSDVLFGGNKEASSPGSQSSSRRASVVSMSMLRQGWDKFNGKEHVPDEPDDGSFDLNGLDGTAKLGKLMVYPNGLPFLDLLVSANMVAFCRMYKLCLKDKKARAMQL